MTTGLFGLNPEDYWKAPWKNAAELDERYVFAKAWGIYIDAPPAVAPEEKSGIPAPFLYVARMCDAYKVDLRTMTKVVASRIEDRAFFIANALPASDNQDTPGTGKDSTALTCSKYTLDLEPQLRLLHKPGTYKIAVLLQQQMSNLVQTTIESLLPTFQDPSPPAPPSPELLKSIEQLPAIPALPGIVLDVDRVVLDMTGTSAILRGSFRLPVLTSEIVPDPQPWIVFGESWLPDYGTPRPSAILPITLVILASGDAAEIVIRLRVPTFDPLDPHAEQPLATGSFAVDLFSNPNIRGRAQIYSIYAFCGEFVAGPAITATVTEDMLPK